MPSRLSYVWLSLKRGLGSRTAAEVLDAFGSPEAVFRRWKVSGDRMM